MTFTKESIRRLARECGGVPSRYGPEFGTTMSTVALLRFAEKIKELALKEQENTNEL